MANDFFKGFAVGQKLVGALGDSVQAINSNAQSRKTDQIAQMLAQGGSLDAPRAQATGPNADVVQAAADARAAKQPGMLDGLRTEDTVKLLQLQNAVRQTKQQRIEDSLRNQTNTRAWNQDTRSQEYLNLQKQQEQRLQQQMRDTAAARAASASTSKMKEAVSDSDAYHLGVAATVPKIQNARTRQDYEAQVSALQSLYSGAATRGLKVQPVSVPPFRGDVIADAMKAYQSITDPNTRTQIVARLRQMGIDPREAGIESKDTGATPPWASGN